jgi:hypothetical protein
MFIDSQKFSLFYIYFKSNKYLFYLNASHKMIFAFSKIFISKDQKNKILYKKLNNNNKHNLYILFFNQIQGQQQ